MAKDFVDLRRELNQMQIDLNFLQKTDCSNSENQKYLNDQKNGNQLPKNVIQYRSTSTGEYLNEFYTVKDSGLTEDERRLYIELKKLEHIKTIKNCILFFTVTAVIGLIATFLLSLQ